MRKALTHAILSSVGFLLLLGASAAAGVEVFDIRYWTAPDHTRIVLDLNQLAYYDVFELRDPCRLVIDVKEARSLVKTKELLVNDQVVSKVRWGYFKPDVLRVVIDLVRASRSTVFTLKKYLDKPDRLVIDVFRTDLEQNEEEKRSSFKKSFQGTRIVVIDPGHGGEDPGAIGPSGTQEKTVVLQLAKKVRDLINGEAGFKAFLTREKDYFIPLRQRWKIAKQYDADIFISLHTNASFNRKKKGAEVYCLSQQGASQEAARILAAKENASDLIGGVDLSACSSEVDSILVSLEQTRTINEGLMLGKTLLQEMKTVNSINFPEPLQAGFAVLKAPDIPSVLIEVGYISNPTEEKVLLRREFQGKVAAAIKKSVVLFCRDIHREIAFAPEAQAGSVPGAS
ncbi:MAG: N-acetylmuramoyl-L-alanine amidase [Deltaproteobacteria bacterium]|nr:N-acetylmuramoyl-L-alanine amidase [Deltaproteobacteria bacterium]